MKSNLLFPNKLRVIGWFLTIPGFVFGYLTTYNGFDIPGFGLKLRERGELFLPAYENFTNELALTLIVVGLLFVAFSKQRREDELTAQIRLNALYWAIVANFTWYGLFIILAMFNVLVSTTAGEFVVDIFSNRFGYMIYNLFTPLVIFTGRFYYLIYRHNDEYHLKPLKFLPHQPYSLLGKALTIALVMVMVVGSLINKDEEIATNTFMVLPFAMLLWAYSKEKQEDEYINNIRLSAMQIAVYTNYAILLISSWFVYGPNYLYVLLFNLATIPFIFLVVFRYRLYKLNTAEGGKSDLKLNLL